ncbi:MAG: hypothetical protein IJW40_04830 [Clostridia bacterium]|nr:hypothetical protein [Clostridia bacterium]
MNPDTKTPLPIRYAGGHSRSVKKSAADILSRPGIRMSMILATLLFISVWIGTLYLVENTWLALDWSGLYESSPLLYSALDILLYLVDGLIVIFLCIPLAYGWFRFMYLAAGGVTPPYSVLFTAFGNQTIYLRSLALMLRLLLRCAIPLLIFAAAAVIAFLFFTLGGVFGIFLMVIFSVLAAVALLLGTLYNAGVTLVIFLDINHPDLSVKTLFAQAKQLLEKKKAELWLMELTLIPWLLLGLVTIGTVLIFHTIPLYFISLQRALCGITGEILPVAETVTKSTT